MTEAVEVEHSEDEVGRWEALSVPLYRQLVAGAFFTFFSMQMTVLARGWLAEDLLGTNTALGGVLIGFGASSIITIPIGGVLADRYPKRSVLIVSGLFSFIMSFGLFLAIATDIIEYWMLIVASIIQGMSISLLGPARLAFIAEAVPRRLLTNGVFLSQSTMQLTRVFGPALAGVLIAVNSVGIGGVYLIATIISALGLAVTISLPPGNPSTTTTRKAPLAEMGEGLRYVRSNPEVFQLIALSYAVVLLGFSYNAFMPAFAEDIFDVGSVGLGVLTTAGAIGALAVTLRLAGAKAHQLWNLQSMAAALFGVGLVIFAVMPVFPPAVVAIMFVGGASAAFQALNNSLIINSVPVEFHGRVQSLLMLSFSGFGLAALPIGIIADAVGLRQTTVVLGIGVTTVTAISFAVRRARLRLDLTTV